MRSISHRSVFASVASNRKAEQRVNAMLNYLYSLVEAEAILACQTVGLDPGLGFVHADVKGRQSLALDLMEPVRPEVDAFVLDMVEHRTFRKVEFTETSDGHVRLLARLTHELAETMPQWAKTLGPIAEHVAQVLRQDDGRLVLGGHPAHVPPPSRCAGGREGAQNRGISSCECRQGSPAPTCSADCSCVVDVSRLWKSCDKSSPRPLRRVHRRRPRLVARDPWQVWRRHRGPQAGAVGVEQGNPDTIYDPELFRREMLPRLAAVKLSGIIEAPGCSKAYASDIRRGKWTPHVSTWAALAELVDAVVESAAQGADTRAYRGDGVASRSDSLAEFTLGRRNQATP
jgi:hypothetical protein